jgi:hypothetical protein
VEWIAEMSFAYQEEIERKQPSIERGKVANWIVWPSILLIICGVIMFAGFGIVYREFFNAPIDEVATLSGWFVFGCGLMGGGLLGAFGVIVYTVSFDGSPRTSKTTKRPVMMTPNEVQQTVSGNGATFIPSRNPHVVQSENRKYEFTQAQMNHLADRYFQDDTDFRVVRDNAKGQKQFNDWPFAKIVMGEVGYWVDKGNGTYWTEEGGDWFEERMRLINQ